MTSSARVDAHHHAWDLHRKLAPALDDAGIDGGASPGDVFRAVNDTGIQYFETFKCKGFAQ